MICFRPSPASLVSVLNNNLWNVVLWKWVRLKVRVWLSRVKLYVLVHYTLESLLSADTSTALQNHIFCAQKSQQLHYVMYLSLSTTLRRHSGWSQSLFQGSWLRPMKGMHVTSMWSFQGLKTLPLKEAHLNLNYFFQKSIPWQLPKCDSWPKSTTPMLTNWEEYV